MRNSKVLVLDVTDDLRNQVERVTSVLRPRPEVVPCAAIGAVEETIDDRGPFDLVVAGSLVSNDAGLRQLRGLRSRFPQIKLILAFDQWRSSGLRDIVRTGALDVLRLPVDDEVLLEAVEQALNSDPVPSNAVEGLRPSAGKGTVTAVVSATGGCGKTFLATNLGYHLQGRT
ncbi:MAG: hypothetical protein M3Z84_04540, partial [Actinomycetota bacterium]|nr:hypothetical protein [Actinomycetota bacterium]